MTFDFSWPSLYNLWFSVERKTKAALIHFLKCHSQKGGLSLEFGIWRWARAWRKWICRWYLPGQEAKVWRARKGKRGRSTALWDHQTWVPHASFREVRTFASLCFTYYLLSSPPFPASSLSPFLPPPTESFTNSPSSFLERACLLSFTFIFEKSRVLGWLFFPPLSF